jgi:4-nitrophenyl phosphatase
MPPTFLEKGNGNHYQALLDKYDTWLFDCDGVLWNGDRLVEGAKEALKLLRNQSARLIPSGLCDVCLLIFLLSLGGPDKSIVFVTNNATKSRKNYKNKFDKLGIDATVV